MTILSKPVPTKSHNAWEVIGGVHNMLVQRRTEHGLQSNQTFYHKVLYKSTDHYPFRIIYSDDPEDYGDFELPAPPVSPARKKLFGRKSKPLRLVVALAQSREEVLLDWDTIKKARSVLGQREISPAEDWTTMFRAIEIVVRSEEETAETVYCSNARLTEIPDDVLKTPNSPSDDNSTDDEAADRPRFDRNATSDVEDVTSPTSRTTRIVRFTRRICGFLVAVVALALTLISGLVLALVATRVPVESRELVDSAAQHLTGSLLLSVAGILLLRQQRAHFAPAVLDREVQRRQSNGRPPVGSSSAEVPSQSSPQAPNNASTTREGSQERSDSAGERSLSPSSRANIAKYKTQVHVLGTNDIFPPNVAPFEITTPYFRGSVYAKIATTPVEPKLAPYFAGKRRKFEIQMQGTFSIPAEYVNPDGSIKGMICFAANLPHELRIGLALKTFWRVILAVFTRLTRGAAITLGTECPGALPAFTAFAASSLDALIETPPGTSPPSLGVPMLPDTGDLARMRGVERSTKTCPFKNGYTYTCSFHSQNADFEKWTLTNVPGVPVMDLRRFWGDQPLRVGWYLLLPGQDIRTAISRGIPLVQLQVTNALLPSFVKV